MNQSLKKKREENKENSYVNGLKIYEIKFRILKSGKIVKERISTNMSKARIQQRYKNNLGVIIVKIEGNYDEREDFFSKEALECFSLVH